jgi:hypothetical protein
MSLWGKIFGTPKTQEEFLKNAKKKGATVIQVEPYFTINMDLDSGVVSWNGYIKMTAEIPGRLIEFLTSENQIRGTEPPDDHESTRFKETLLKKAEILKEKIKQYGFRVVIKPLSDSG